MKDILTSVMNFLIPVVAASGAAVIVLQVAADILKTGLSRAWDDILQLAALIALRTLLNYLLERELESLNGEKSEPKPSLAQEG